MAELQTPTETSALSTIPVKDAQVQVMPETNGTLTDEPPLFSPAFISLEVTAVLPEGYSIRPLRKSDYHNGKR
jgi:glucosamine-phosphate N-acetyltransferase